MRGAMRLFAVAIFVGMQMAALAGPLTDLVLLNGAVVDPRGLSGEPSMSEQAFAGDAERVCTAVLANPQALRDVVAMADGLTPEVRRVLVEKIRFAVVHDQRNDLRDVLAVLARAGTTKPALSSDNMLQIPMRVGRLEISCLFIKKYGAILRCDRQRFQATLDTVAVDVTPNPVKPGDYILVVSGTAPAGSNLPQGPLHGRVTTNGTTATVTADDGTTIQVTHKGNGVYKIASSLLPATVTAKYID